MAATLRFSASLSKSDPQDNPVLIVGLPKNLAKITYEDVKLKLEPRVTEEVYNAGVQNTSSGTCSLWLNKANIAALPVKCSRHNTPTRAHALAKIIKSCLSGKDDYIVMVCERGDVMASASALARNLPLYSAKSSTSALTSSPTVTMEFLLVDGDRNKPLTDEDLGCLDALAFGIRLAAKIVDIPCADMHTNLFLEEVRSVGKLLNIEPVIIQGEQLREKGFGGIYGVGKAAINQPALAVLSYCPSGAEKNIAWVGKGIVYDTGGLSIKSKTGMCGMKRDCGGAAGILGAFYMAVKMGFQENLHAVMCLAENAVGPNSVRPDDVLTLYSGKTVEINNTDAEGRLVLGDGVAYAQKDLKADVVLDMATLTGAQGISTGKYHAAIVTNSEDWELACVKAGQNSGDLVHPMPYSPELHYPEFNSTIADMKNSVADRTNAQVSCAGLFIGSHLGFDFPGIWLHIDMAYPVHAGERATGYGPALLNTLFGDKSSSSLLQAIAPPISFGDQMETDDSPNDSAPKKLKT